MSEPPTKKIKTSSEPPTLSYTYIEQLITTLLNTRFTTQDDLNEKLQPLLLYSDNENLIMLQKLITFANSLVCNNRTVPISEENKNNVKKSFESSEKYVQKDVSVKAKARALWQMWEKIKSYLGLKLKNEIQPKPSVKHEQNSSLNSALSSTLNAILDPRIRHMAQQHLLPNLLQQPYIQLPKPPKQEPGSQLGTSRTVPVRSRPVAMGNSFLQRGGQVSTAVARSHGQVFPSVSLQNSVRVGNCCVCTQETTCAYKCLICLSMAHEMCAKEKLPLSVHYENFMICKKHEFGIKSIYPSLEIFIRSEEKEWFFKKEDLNNLDKILLPCKKCRNPIPFGIYETHMGIQYSIDILQKEGYVGLTESEPSQVLWIFNIPPSAPRYDEVRKTCTEAPGGTTKCRKMEWKRCIYAVFKEKKGAEHVFNLLKNKIIDSQHLCVYYQKPIRHLVMKNISSIARMSTIDTLARAKLPDDAVEQVEYVQGSGCARITYEDFIDAAERRIDMDRARVERGVVDVHFYEPEEIDSTIVKVANFPEEATETDLCEVLLEGFSSVFESTESKDGYILFKMKTVEAAKQFQKKWHDYNYENRHLVVSFFIEPKEVEDPTPKYIRDHRRERRKHKRRRKYYD